MTKEAFEKGPDQDGQAILHSYFRAGIGRQKETAAASGILASTLSSMAHGRIPITLESAVLIDVATEGAVRAQSLCPTRAEALNQFLRLHAGEVEASV